MALSQSINDPDVTPAIAPVVTALLLLGLILVVASRGKICVMVFISDIRSDSSDDSRSIDIVRNSYRLGYNRSMQ